MTEPTGIAEKLRWNLPWLARYPRDRARAFLERTAFEKKHIIFTIADHFEPGWAENCVLDRDTQLRRLDKYVELARSTGEAVRDSDGTKFRHTNFYPAEQYDAAILDRLAEMQSEGLGETEVHLHHGVERPDNADNLFATLIEFRDRLAGEHRCLSRMDGAGEPRYAFVHGNLALANSCGGKFCGVDNEMQILADTGCYADFTLPSAPDRTQVPVINKIYECGAPLDTPVPHRSGLRLGANGNSPRLPLIFTGPLVLTASRRGLLPRPKIEDGALTAALGSDPSRLDRWTSANITVAGRSDWIFVKLYCHGFFDHDQDAAIGEGAKRLFSSIVENGEKTRAYKTHFVSSREMFNMALAAADKKHGDPNEFRDYRLRTIMNEN